MPRGKTWLEWIVEAVRNLGEPSLQEIYKEVRRLSGMDVNDATIRKDIERHSSDSRNYQGGPDLFESVEGLGRGRWRLRRAPKSPAARAASGAAR